MPQITGRFCMCNVTTYYVTTLGGECYFLIRANRKIREKEGECRDVQHPDIGEERIVRRCTSLHWEEGVECKDVQRPYIGGLVHLMNFQRGIRLGARPRRVKILQKNSL